MRASGPVERVVRHQCPRRVAQPCKPFYGNGHFEAKVTPSALAEVCGHGEYEDLREMGIAGNGHEEEGLGRVHDSPERNKRFDTAPWPWWFHWRQNLLHGGTGKALAIPEVGPV